MIQCLTPILPTQYKKHLSVGLIHKSQNTPLSYPTMLHSEQKCSHFCSEWSIVGYGTGAFWDWWNCSVLMMTHLGPKICFKENNTVITEVIKIINRTACYMVTAGVKSSVDTWINSFTGYLLCDIRHNVVTTVLWHQVHVSPKIPITKFKVGWKHIFVLNVLNWSAQNFEHGLTALLVVHECAQFCDMIFCH